MDRRIRTEIDVNYHDSGLPQGAELVPHRIAALSHVDPLSTPSGEERPDAVDHPIKGCPRYEQAGVACSSVVFALSENVARDEVIVVLLLEMADLVSGLDS